MKRKNPYSSVDVNLISIESLTRQRAGHAAAVGVDVARGELVLCVVWPDRSFERPWSVKSPGQIHLAVSKLVELNASCPVTVAMESSGTYGDCFRQALFDAGLAVHRVSARAVKDDSEGFDGVPSNHDGKDLRAMNHSSRTRLVAARCAGWTRRSVSSRCGAGSWRGCWHGTGRRRDACLVLREHQKKSYRGIEALLADASDLRDAIDMTGTPDHNTLCRAFKLLIKSSKMNSALDLTVARGKADGLNASGDTIKPATMDSTCLKRNLGSALRAKSAGRRSMELLLRCVTHNIMVLEGTQP